MMTTIRKKKRVPWRKQEGWIKFVPDSLNLIVYTILLFISYNLENKFIPIAFACYAILHVINLMRLVAEALDKKNAINNGPTEEDTLWRITVSKIAELTIGTFLLINIAKYAIPLAFHIGSVDAWIGFAGSIIAGFITMMALLFTIRHERKIRDDDKALSVMPVLVIEPIYSSKKKNDFSPENLEIRNLTSNIAMDLRLIQVTKSKVIYSGKDFSLIKKWDVENYPCELNMIDSPLAGFSSIKLDVPLDSMSDAITGQSYMLEIVIGYFDILGLREYINILTLRYSYEAIELIANLQQIIPYVQKIVNKTYDEDDTEFAINA